MKVLVNYASPAFRKSQLGNSKSALSVAGFDEVRSFGVQDIDSGFFRANRAVLRHDKGDGYWLWKPYFVHRVLQELQEGDLLFYCDSGAEFVNSLEPLFQISSKSTEDLMVFALSWPEKAWTKRDAFVLMNCDELEFWESKQRLGGFHLWRRSEKSLALCAEWLKLCQDVRLVTDLANQCGLPNHPEFREHRHDQSLLSLLSKKHGIEAFRDPSQWGNEHMEDFTNSPYPQLIDSTRAREKQRLIKLWIRKLLKQFR